MSYLSWSVRNLFSFAGFDICTLSTATTESLTLEIACTTLNMSLLLCPYLPNSLFYPKSPSYRAIILPTLRIL